MNRQNPDKGFAAKTFSAFFTLLCCITYVCNEHPISKSVTFTPETDKSLIYK